MIMTCGLEFGKCFRLSCVWIQSEAVGSYVLALLRDYFVLSLFTMGGMYLTNWSLEYLNYPTRVVFKSSKVIPTMFVGVLVQHKSYSVPEYISAFVLVIGIVVFTLGDAKESPKFNIYGVLLISLGVIADALTSNLQEGKFFRKLKCSQAEVMLFCSLFGSLNALLAIVAEGSLFPAVNFAVEHPEMVLWTITFSTLGYCSVMFVLLLIKRFGATNAEIVKSCRKVFSILLSFFLYAKPISSMHFIGGAFFVGSVLMGVQIKARKQQKRQETSKPPAEDIEELLAKNAETRS